MPPLGWENRVWRPGNARGAWGGASRLMAERPGFGGWGDRSTCLYVTADPITRNSALGDYPLSLGIGPPKVASAQAARYQTQNMVDYRERAEECRRLAKLRAGSEHWAAFLEMAETWEQLGKLQGLSRRLKSAGILRKRCQQPCCALRMQYGIWSSAFESSKKAQEMGLLKVSNQSLRALGTNVLDATFRQVSFFE
jgi:hypothetical protein